MDAGGFITVSGAGEGPYTVEYREARDGPPLKSKAFGPSRIALGEALAFAEAAAGAMAMDALMARAEAVAGPCDCRDCVRARATGSN